MRFLISLSLLLAACGAAPEPADPGGTPPVADSPDGTTTSSPDPSGEPGGTEDSVPAITGGTRLPPVDDANASFAAFRRELLGIIERRDADALLAIVDPNIRFTFGAGGGRDDFAEHWNLGEADSELWGELGEVLRLGGTFQGDRFVAPYTFSAWPENVDGFTHLAVVCDDAIARAAASESAEALGRLDYQVLRIGPEDAGFGSSWRQVTLPDGRQAYVEAECVRSHVDYRAAFAPSEDGWKLEFFVAGD